MSGDNPVFAEADASAEKRPAIDATVQDRDKGPLDAVTPVQDQEWPDDIAGCPSVSIEFLRNHSILPLGLTEGALHLAMADPTNEFAIQAIRMASGLPVVPRPAAGEDILAAIERIERRQTQPPAAPARRADDRVTDDVEHLRDLALGTPVVRYVNDLMRDALRLRATDIHLEPFEGRLTVRFRVDGLLQERPTPDTGMAAAVVSRIKILAGLDIAEHRLPQDGRTRIQIDGRAVDIRVATMPAIHGESVVLRLLDNDASKLDFERLGFGVPDIVNLTRALDAPHGLIVVTGPTGSGKTTTLATALKHLNTAQRKILTIEDPIEYELAGVNQTQIKPAIGLTFARALRGFLRHDPDVIMVGEMRDVETAQIGVHAALTGHLVLTTLHTNTAAGAVVRLLDMGVDAYLLASTLKCVVGQRLVRTLCPNCRSGTADENASIPVGCGRCQQTGYLGRAAIVEVLNVGKEISSLIKPSASEAEIDAAARSSGMMSMSEDGMAKYMGGLTTREEVLRVTQDV
ncbi:MAG: GspE/PulE family protein [Hyphomicrobiaceae bacterium]